MTKILIEVPDHIHRAAKVAAARLGITLKQYVLDAIETANQKEQQQ